MDEKYISGLELIWIQFLLGSVVYLVGSIVFFFVLRKVGISKYKKIMLLLSQFCISVILSFVIWGIWTLNIDIMIFEFINLPALIAECVTIPIMLYVLRWLKKEN